MNLTKAKLVFIGISLNLKFNDVDGFVLLVGSIQNMNSIVVSQLISLNKAMLLEQTILYKYAMPRSIRYCIRRYVHSLDFTSTTQTS